MKWRTCDFSGAATPEEWRFPLPGVTGATAGAALATTATPFSTGAEIVGFNSLCRGNHLRMTEQSNRPSLADVTLRREAIADGLTDRDIAGLVRTGEWHRIRHGAYCDGGLWRSLGPGGHHMLQSRAVVRQAQTEVVLSHASAVPEYGGPAELLDLDAVHVTRLDQRAGRAEAGVRQHQGALGSDDVVVVGDVLVTTPTRTAIDVTTVAGVEASVAVLLHLFREGHTSLERVRARYASMTRHPYTAQTEVILRRVERQTATH